MGVYFNPGNESFAKDKNYKIYVDKTGLLNDLNELIPSVRTPCKEKGGIRYAVDTEYSL